MALNPIVISQAGPYIGSLFNFKQVAANLGNYYSFASGSVAGPIVGLAAVTSLVTLTEASPFLIIENTAAGTGPNITLDYVRIQATAIAAAGTDWAYAWKLDNVRNKWASAGTTMTPQNVNAGAANSSAGTVHGGALVVATAQQSSSNAKLIGAEFLAPVGTAPVQIIGDLVDFRFGGNEAALPTVISNVASNGAHTFASGHVVPLPPVVLSPGTTATLFLWGTLEASAPSYTVHGGWYEY